MAGGASAVPENIEDSTRWRGASADKPHSHIELQSAAFHAAGATSLSGKEAGRTRAPVNIIIKLINISLK
ncbi:hypothetical protein C9Z70_25905 (plasmid) [Escherichia coli]|nr:hypothetical protein AW074_23920 [Escherichia coli]TJP93873.1 hypothetical protein C9Z70_25905 [Escherichia coli]